MSTLSGVHGEEVHQVKLGGDEDRQRGRRLEEVGKRSEENSVFVLRGKQCQ